MVEKKVSQLEMEKNSILSNKDQNIFSKSGDDDKPETRNILLFRYPLMNIPENKWMIEVDRKEKTGSFPVAKQ